MDSGAARTRFCGCRPWATGLCIRATGAQACSYPLVPYCRWEAGGQPWVTVPLHNGSSQRPLPTHSAPHRATGAPGSSQSPSRPLSASCMAHACPAGLLGAGCWSLYKAGGLTPPPGTDSKTDHEMGGRSRAGRRGEAQLQGWEGLKGRGNTGQPSPPRLASSSGRGTP